MDGFHVVGSDEVQPLDDVGAMVHVFLGWYNVSEGFVGRIKIWREFVGL